ncbi:hypothetical protein [uncultured Sphaerochaeta sp.]|uniref:hypothetical protein n=1 Tax=uncultured Sphaerochaeta sp. TaxID=886478 RepID=UPI0026197768|nr:hypothetical protein [uncultured Sphaerochaeta sp.]
MYDNQWYQNLSIQNGDAAYLNNRTYINGDATSVGGGGTTGATFTPGSMTLRYKIFGKVLFIKATLAFAITGTVQSFRLNIWNTTEFAGITPVGGEQALVYLEEAGIGTGFAFLSIGSKTSLTSGIYIRKATAGNFSAYADGSVSIIIPVELS